MTFPVKPVLFAVAAMLVAPVQAASPADAATNTDAETDADAKAWRAMREEVVSASKIIDGVVTDAIDPLGSVRDLLLDPERQAVQYVLYQVPFSLRTFGQQDGYVAFDNVAVQRGGVHDIDLRIDDPASAKAPETLELTAQEADHRLVSRILDQPLIFPTGAERNVEDLLIDRQTGEVRHLVVNMAHEALFNAEPRTIPRKRVTIDQAGRLATDARINEIADLQVYNPLMLTVH